MVSSRARTIGIVMAIVGLLVVAAACGGGGSKSSASDKTTESVAPAGALNPTAGASTSAGGSAAPAASTGNSQNISPVAADWDRKIIRNANIALRVTSVESMLATVRSITDNAGGIVFASSTSFNGEDQIASMTLDIPADRFDEVINALRSAPGVKKVATETVTSQDVTDDYVDLQSQLRNLQATQSRLLTLMNQATQLQDILTLEQELSKVEGQIEQTTGRINYLGKHTSFSRITLTLTPFGGSSSATTAPEHGLGNAVRDAWDASMRFTGRILTGVVEVGVFMWWLWPLVAIAAGYIYLRRQRRRDAGENPEIPA